MSTIDQLMEGKAPGEIKITCERLESWFWPFYKNKYGAWFGLDIDGFSISFTNDFGEWQIFQAPKPTKVVYEWMVKGKYWEVERCLIGEDKADDFFAGVPHRKTGRSFTVECE